MAYADAMASQPPDFLIGKVDTMRQPCSVVEPAVFLQIVHRPATELLQAVSVFIMGFAQMGMQSAI